MRPALWCWVRWPPTRWLGSTFPGKRLLIGVSLLIAMSGRSRW
jgi:hypothetical protein